MSGEPGPVEAVVHLLDADSADRESVLLLEAAIRRWKQRLRRNERSAMSSDGQPPMRDVIRELRSLTGFTNRTIGSLVGVNGDRVTSWMQGTGGQDVRKATLRLILHRYRECNDDMERAALSENLLSGAPWTTTASGGIQEKAGV